MVRRWTLDWEGWASLLAITGAAAWSRQRWRYALGVLAQLLMVPQSGF